MSWEHYCIILLGISWALVGFYRSYALRKGYVDSPNVRSSHTKVTPRGGGIVFGSLWFALMGALVYKKWVDLNTVFIFLPAFAVMLIGFIDDMKSQSKTVRFIVQGVAAGASLYLMNISDIQLPINMQLPIWLVLSILGLFVVSMTNITNFMDGSDGYAASHTMIVLGVGSYLLLQLGAYSLATLAIGLCALIGGFLTWNWPKAGIFMGDSGSGLLGFVVAVMAIASYHFYNIPLEFWLILTASFWFDASVTLLRRILSRDKWTEPHCLHAYQRLLQVGWSHSGLLVASILVHAILAFGALWAYDHPELRLMVLGTSVCFLTFIYLLIEMVRPMYRMWHA